MIIEIRAGFVSRASCSTNRYWLSSRFCLSCNCNITCVVANWRTFQQYFCTV